MIKKIIKLKEQLITIRNKPRKNINLYQEDGYRMGLDKAIEKISKLIESEESI